MISVEKLYIFDDEFEYDGSGSGSPSTCDFPFCYGNSVGCVSGVGSGVFVPTGIDSIGDVVPLVVFVPRDDLLRENRTECMQSLSTSHSILHNRLVNRQDCDWDNLWDEPVDQ